MAQSPTTAPPEAPPSRAALVARPRRWAEQLPALEPERRIDDWGRSERAEAAFDRLLGDFLYRYWFRCEVQGIANVPASGPALLVANRAGLLPPDALMVAKAIREEHPSPRPLRVIAGERLRAWPGVSMLAAKLGGIPAHRTDVERLLADERGLLLGFPEAGGGAAKAYADRYRLAPFGSGGFLDAAIGAGAAIVPVCVVGSEEAMPVLGRSRALGRLAGVGRLPITPTFPWLGPVGVATYLPAKFRIRFLPAIAAERLGSDAAGDRRIVESVSEEVRARIQQGLFEMLGRRRSAWT